MVKLVIWELHDKQADPKQAYLVVLSIQWAQML